MKEYRQIPVKFLELSREQKNLSEQIEDSIKSNSFWVEDYTGRVINPTTQQEGIDDLRDFLKGEKSFFEVRPFLVNKARVYESTAHIPIRKFSSNREVIITANKEMHKILSKGSTIIAVPQEDENKLYQWIDFYAIDEGSTVLQIEIGSYRVDAKNFKIESRGWNGVNKQMFLDYLVGSIHIDPEILRPFTGKIRVFNLSNKEKYKKNPTVIHIGYVNSKNIVATGIEDSYGKEGKEILFIPRYDKERGYTWIDGYINDGKENEEVFVTKRFYKGDTRLYEWKGSEIQALIDWINGTVPFEKSKSAKVSVAGKSKLIDLEDTSHSQIFIRLGGNSSVSQYDQVILVPQKDELYEWIEAYKINPDGEKDLALLASYRVVRSKRSKLDATWIGSERQRYIDYLDGKLTFDSLKPFKAKVDPNKRIYIFVYNGKELELQLYGFESFSSGKEIIIKPRLEPSGELMLEVWKSGEETVLKQFVFNKEKCWFDPIKQPAWPPERIEQEAKIFYEKEGAISHLLLQQKGRTDLSGAISRGDYPGGMYALQVFLGTHQPSDYKADKSGLCKDRDGEEWTSLGYLNRRYRIDYKTLRKHLSNVDSVPGISFVNSPVTLCNLRQTLEILEKQGLLTRRGKKKNTISPEEADEMIRKLLEEE